MKDLYKLLVLTILLNLSYSSYAQNVSINRDGSAPDGSAMLDIAATDAGILIPRMTEAQKNAISSPANGLLIYQTNATPGFRYYNGTIWVPMVSRFTQDISFGQKDRDHYELDKSVYTTYGYVLFRGTSIVGVPTKMTAVAYSDGGEAFSIRVRDTTNSTNIVTRAGLTNTSSAIIDLGTISNLPSGEAIFAIQGKKDAGDKGRLQSISILY